VAPTRTEERADARLVQTLHGIRFVPLLRIDGMLLGLDARWLDIRGWGLMLLLALATPVINQSDSGPAVRLLTGLSMVVAVVLTSLGHELGHVVASRIAGLSVRALVLAPQGGVTIRGGCDTPKVNLLTALAGPLANAVLGAVCISLLIALGPDGQLGQFLIELAALQLLVAVANLVPWGPMDGQRIMAAWAQFEQQKTLSPRVSIVAR
jgi:Zn-dependent protease